MKSNLIIALNAIEKHDLELGVYDDLKVEMKGANIGAMKAIDLANSAKKPA
jgi:hypothetical protein